MSGHLAALNLTVQNFKTKQAIFDKCFPLFDELSLPRVFNLRNCEPNLAFALYLVSVYSNRHFLTLLSPPLLGSWVTPRNLGKFFLRGCIYVPGLAVVVVVVRGLFWHTENVVDEQRMSFM